MLRIDNKLYWAGPYLSSPLGQIYEGRIFWLQNVLRFPLFPILIWGQKQFCSKYFGQKQIFVWKKFISPWKRVQKNLGGKNYLLFRCDKTLVKKICVRLGKRATSWPNMQAGAVQDFKHSWNPKSGSSIALGQHLTKETCLSQFPAIFMRDTLASDWPSSPRKDGWN